MMTGSPHLESPPFERLQRGLSIVIPAWNEATRLRPTLERLIGGLVSVVDDYEIIVVADGCTDGTVQTARSFPHEHVRVIELPKRIGKGAAITRGVCEAKYDTTGFLDADSPITQDQLKALLDALGRTDCVIASRWAPGQRPHFHDDRLRNFLSVAWSVLARVMLLTTVYDSQCGAKFFRTRELRQIVTRVTVRGWAFDVAVLFHWNLAGNDVREVPIRWPDGPGSKLRVRRAVPIMFLSMLGLRLVHSPLGSLTSQRWRYNLHVKLARLASGFQNAPQFRQRLGIAPASTESYPDLPIVSPREDGEHRGADSALSLQLTRPRGQASSTGALHISDGLGVGEDGVTH